MSIEERTQTEDVREQSAEENIFFRWEELRQDWRKLRNEELYHLHCPPSITRMNE